MNTILLILYVVIYALAGFMTGFRLHRAFHRFRQTKNYTLAVDAPSISVCIPARNETHALADCLERVLQSDYKKMEILVFDDESHDDTSAIIRSFAHAGVRFIPGTALPEGWLGKNHALEVLTREASGTYILFLDIDTTISTTTISQLVSYTMTGRLDMVSVIPVRSDGWRMSVLFGTLRYYVELIRSSEKAPATSGALWMITRSALLDRLGGFASTKANVSPEQAFATTLGTPRYHCLLGNDKLGVTYQKKWRSAVETARRLWYPNVGGQLSGALAAAFMLGLLTLPLFVLIFALGSSDYNLSIASLAIIGIFMCLYGYYTRRMWRQAWLVGALLWPLIVIQEFILLIGSIIGYSQGTITWKNRRLAAGSKSASSYVIDQPGSS